MTVTAKYSRLELIQKSFDCCIQIVKSYGNPNLDNDHREGLINCMEHFKMLYEKVVSNEKAVK